MTHTNNGREFWLQVVPEDASDFSVRMGYLDYTTQGGCDYSSLPSGTWAIHSDSSSITEEQAAELVEVKEIEEHGVVYIEYAPDDEYDYWCGCATAIKSFESLLRFLNINQRVIILEKL